MAIVGGDFFYFLNSSLEIKNSQQGYYFYRAKTTTHELVNDLEVQFAISRPLYLFILAQYYAHTQGLKPENINFHLKLHPYH